MAPPSDSRSSDETADPGDHLDSWKEISRYLQRDVRTLRRWERDRGLPIHRAPGGRKPGVFARKCELDAWRNGRTVADTGPSSAPSGTLERSAPDPSIAVLPFANLSGDKENEYFSDGLADDIITALAQLPGLHVTARTSAFAFRGKNQDVREIGGRLNVGMLLEGSVRKAGRRIRVTAQLVNVTDGFHLWSDSYDLEMTDVFAIQDQITRAIVDGLRVRLVVERPLIRRQTENIEAYSLCLKGRYHIYRQTPDDMAKSRHCFERAVALDANYPLGYLGLAELSWLGAFYGLVPPKEAAANGKAATLKALELDEMLGLAHAVLGVFLGFHDFDWSQTEREFKRAIELSPASPDVHSRYVWNYLVPTSRLDEAVVGLKRVSALDPVAPLSYFQLGALFMLRREYDRAAEQLHVAIELDANYWLAHWVLATTQLLSGNVDEALETSEKARDLCGGMPMAAAHTGAMYGWAGRPRETRQVLDHLKRLARTSYVSSLSFAWLYMGLQELDQTFEWLDRAIDERDPQILQLPCKPIYDGLRADPRFPALLRKMGLENWA